MTAEAMPALFVGHGSPMNAIESNRYTDAWAAVGAAMPAPAAILAVSAHWYINATAVTAMVRPRTIHDFYGFPDELFAYDYPAPGAPAVAEAVAAVADPVWVGLDRDSWGIDHGTWSVLAHMFPGADVPVLQLSINAMKPAGYHVDLGRRLAPLRQQGVLILASGNIVHNLSQVDFRHPEHGYDWAERFDADARAVLTTSPGSVLDLARHPDYARAVPTPDHYLPLLYLAGLAAEEGDTEEGEALDVVVEGCAYGSISMTAYALGGCVDQRGAPPGGAGDLPDPDVVPPEGTNI